MTLPANFTTAVQSNGYAGHWWIEVEGWPYAFGTFTADATFFTPRTDTAEEFLAVKPWVARDSGGRLHAPEMSASKIDFLGGKQSTSTLRLSLLDVDATTLHALTGVMRTDGWLRLTADETTTSTEWVVGGTPGSAAADWPASGTCYCGTECCTFTRASSTLTVVRGRYRTRGEKHSGAGTTGGKLGAIVTQYPRALIGRRVWVRYWAGSSTGTPVDADSITAFHGRIVDWRWTGDGRILSLDCDDAVSILSAPVGAAWFRAQRRNQSLPITFESGLYQDWRGVADYPSCMFSNLPVPAAADSSESRYLTHEDELGGGAEIVRWEPATASDANWWKVKERGILTYNFGGHLPGNGAVVQPTFIVGGPRATGYTDFLNDHPLKIALAFLVSTGTATVDSSRTITAGDNGAYDTLPMDWGLRFPAASVDVAGIERLADQNALFAVSIPLWAPIDDFRKWSAQELLAPFGYYWTQTAEGKITIRTMESPTIDDGTNATAITLAKIIRDPSSGMPKIGDVRSSFESIVRSAKWRAAPTLLAGPKLEPNDIAAISFADDTDAADTNQAGIDVEIVCHGIHQTAVRSGDGFGLMPTGWQADKIALRWVGLVGKRFTSAAAVFDVTCRMSLFEVMPGDLVSLTVATHPANAGSATRGFSGEICEVWNRHVSLADGTVTLTLAQTNALPSGRRLIAPAATVASRVLGVLTLTEHSYVPAATGYHDSGAFDVNSLCHLYDSDMDTVSGQLTISAIAAGGGEITVTGIDPGDPGSGILILDDYGSALDADEARFAFRSDYDEMLGAADAPHVLA